MPGLMDLLGGGGAPPGMGGPPPPGAEGQAPPSPMDIVGLLTGQKSPPQAGQPDLFVDAQNALGVLSQKIMMRSAPAAKLLADALSKVHQAKMTLEKEGSRPLNSPPDLGMGMPPGMSSGAMPGGMGM